MFDKIKSFVCNNMQKIFTVVAIGLIVLATVFCCLGCQGLVNANGTGNSILVGSDVQEVK